MISKIIISLCLNFKSRYSECSGSCSSTPGNLILRVPDEELFYCIKSTYIETIKTVCDMAHQITISQSFLESPELKALDIDGRILPLDYILNRLIYFLERHVLPSIEQSVVWELDIIGEDHSKIDLRWEGLTLRRSLSSRSGVLSMRLISTSYFQI